MRIDYLNLTFGPFKQHEYDLSSGRQGLHLIHGPNESGKSSTLRAIYQFFDDIDSRSTDNFLTKYEDLRIGARLRSANGTTLELIRRKGLKNKLLNFDDSPAPDGEKRLKAMLGGEPPNDFARRFVLDHDRLEQGGKAIIEGGGDLGEMLFAAGTGIGGFRKVREQLERESQALFKKGGSNPEINRKLADLETLLAESRKSQLKGTDWQELQDRLAGAELENNRLREAIERASQTRSKAVRIRSAIDLAKDRKILREDLERLADAPILADDFHQRRMAHTTALHVATESVRDLEAKLERLQSEIAGIEIPKSLLDHHEAIEDLQDRRLGFIKAKNEKIASESTLAQAESKIRSILSDLGRAAPDLTEKNLDALRLKTADRAAVQKLLQRRQAIESNRQAIRKTRDAFEKRWNAAKAKAGSLQEPPSLNRLQPALKAARTLGDLEGMIESDRLENEKATIKAAKQLKRLPGWSGTLEEAESLALPLPEAIERFREAIQEAQANLKDVVQKIKEMKGEALTVEAQIQSMNTLGDLPTESALTEARGVRDRYWSSLKVNWDRDVARKFEESMQSADEQSDRLRRETERVTLHGRHLADRDRLKTSLESLEADHRQAQSRLDDLKQSWQSLWKPLRVEPSSPGEMLAWSNRFAEIVTTAGMIADRQRSIEAREAIVDEQRRILLAELARLDTSSHREADSLRDLINHCESYVETNQKQTKAFENAKNNLEAVESDRPAILDAEAELLNDMDDWQGRWRASMVRIDFSEETDFGIADFLMDKRVELDQTVERLRTARNDLRRFQNEIERFEEDVAKLSKSLDLDHRGEPAELIVSRLSERLAIAKRDRQSHDVLSKQLLEAEFERGEKRRSIAKANEGLERLRIEASCETVDDLEANERRSDARRALEAELDRNTKDLRKLAEVSSEGLEAFLETVETADPVRLDLEIAELGQTIQAETDARERVQQTIGGCRSDINRLNGDTKGAGADASQQADYLRGELRAHFEDYARLRLASALLREGVERYRKKAQGPVLKRASELFSKLTLGSFQGLTVEFNEKDNPIVRAVRTDGQSALGVESLSLGTADQLHFALRLATLETNLNSEEPLPLIVDDVLIQFDDERSIATLEILADLSERTQILMFTHHRHLVEIAKKTIDPQKLFIHHLNRLHAI